MPVSEAIELTANRIGGNKVTRDFVSWPESNA